MKIKFLSLIAAFFVSAAVNAQIDTTEPGPVDTIQPKPSDTTAFARVSLSSYAAYAVADTTNPGDTTQPQPTDTATSATNVSTDATVSANANVPENLRGVTSETLRPEHYLPVLGSYQPAGSSTENVTITLDEQNKGIVWIEGLPQGRIKALLKKSPATYKIPSQKTAEGKSVSGGTLYFDPATKEVSIAIGTAYNEEDPTTVFTTITTSGSKSKVLVYKGTKQDQAAGTTQPTQPVQSTQQ